jgi:ATP-dependent helicase/nuclease subunit B
VIPPLVEFLKTEEPSIPLGTLYELAKSLSLQIKELILHRIDPKRLSSIVPQNLQKYWNHTESMIVAAMKEPKIKKITDLIEEKLNVFLKSTEHGKLITVDIEEQNYYTKLLLKNATKHGIAIFSDRESAKFNGENVEYLECNSIFDEGLGVAIAIRKAVAEQKNVLVVSPNPDLTEIIKSELKRWNISADDSKGTSFLKTGDGMLVSLAMDMVKKLYDCTSVINFIKMKSASRPSIEKLELFLRRQKSVPSNFFAAFNLYRGEILQGIEDEDFPALIDKIAEISNGIPPIQCFGDWLDVCHKLISLIDRESVEKLQKIIPTSFLDLPMKIPLQEFCVFFQNHILSLFVRNTGKYTPGVAILGIIEAQLLDMDQIIIADVNEESWFKLSEKNDFWITSSMLNHFGINSNKIKNELRQKVFLKLIHGKNVLITRSILTGNVKQQRYRFFDKITENLKIPTAIWLEELISNVKKADKPEKVDVPRPNPELKLRPTNFWVSDLDLLIHNPYAFYAKRILKLKEINHINELKNVRGNYIHEVLEDFIKNSQDKKSIAELCLSAQKVLKNQRLTPSALGVWFFQLDEILSFIIDNMEEKKYYAEIFGSCSLKISENYEIKIKCRADRIDVDENISIVDYKTGSLPSKTQIREGKKIQLPVESIIAANGGFGLPQTEVENLCLWKLGTLKGENKIIPGGKIIDIAKGKTEINQLNEKITEILKNLIHKYNVLGESYEVNTSSPYDKSYMHLARVKEWRT